MTQKLVSKSTKIDINKNTPIKEIKHEITRVKSFIERMTKKLDIKLESSSIGDNKCHI